MPVLECEGCGGERNLTDASYYEAKRLGKKYCRSCALKRKAPRGSKYDKLISRGDVFGNRTVVSERVSADGSWVLCKCKCGDVSKVRVHKLLQGKSRSCKNCCYGVDGSNWKGVGGLPSTVFTKIKLRAKRRSKEFRLDKKYLWNLYSEQNGRCALSGLEIDFGLDGNKNLSQSQGTASLDRIDSSMGYIEGNVQWVHKHVNSMKNSHTTEYFIKLCKLIVECSND